MYTYTYRCRISCTFDMRDMTYHTCTCTSMHIYNVIYQRTCGCTVCWRTALACFSQAHALSHAFSAQVDQCAVQFSSMATLKLSNWSACRYIRSDLGPSRANYVLLFAKRRYSRCRYTRRNLCGSKWRKVLGKKSASSYAICCYTQCRYIRSLLYLSVLLFGSCIYSLFKYINVICKLGQVLQCFWKGQADL